jgi:2-polyprenyl-6-methoxyphenol hydroxylase-like FAD-dependent oxidoreductase
LGVPPGRILGEPFALLLRRASGREIAAIKLPARGLPHVNVDRAELLDALAATLPDGTIVYSVRCADARELADDHDLVVVADGANSALRPAVADPPGRRWTWTVRQACTTANVPQIPAGAGAAVTRPGLFSGTYRLPGGPLTWFAEQPERQPGDRPQLLRELMDDEDPVLPRSCARHPATGVDRGAGRPVARRAPPTATSVVEERGPGETVLGQCDSPFSSSGGLASGQR